MVRKSLSVSPFWPQQPLLIGGFTSSLVAEELDNLGREGDKYAGTCKFRANDGRDAGGGMLNGRGSNC